MLDPSAEIRKQIALLCRRGRSRRLALNVPCDWHPTTVFNERTGMQYTDAEAFETIGDAIANPLIEVTVVSLRQPPGQIAYEMLIPQRAGCAPIYAKVQLGPGKVLGRSFHYSDYAEKSV